MGSAGAGRAQKKQKPGRLPARALIGTPAPMLRGDAVAV